MNNNLLKLLTNDREIRLNIVDATDIINRNILESIKTDMVKYGLTDELYKYLLAIIY